MPPPVLPSHLLATIRRHDTMTDALNQKVSLLADTIATLERTVASLKVRSDEQAAELVILRDTTAAEAQIDAALAKIAAVSASVA